MTSPNSFSHVVLKSFVMERMRDWYLNVLDARVVLGHPGLSSFLTYDREHHRLAIVQLPGKPPDNVPKHLSGLVHLAYTYANIRGLLNQYANLKQKDILPIASVNHGLTISFYYVDPDGNRVELLIDRLPTVEAGMAMMETPQFKRNPAGYEIDPDALLSRMRAGATDEELIAFNPPAELDPVWMKKHLADMGLAGL